MGRPEELPQSNQTVLQRLAANTQSRARLVSSTASVDSHSCRGFGTASSHTQHVSLVFLFPFFFERNEPVTRWTQRSLHPFGAHTARLCCLSFSFFFRTERACHTRGTAEKIFFLCECFFFSAKFHSRQEPPAAKIAIVKSACCTHFVHITSAE